MTVIPAGALIRNREVPELGSGRIIAELEGGAARVVFENSDEVREVRLEHADIVRQPLIPGTRVRVQKGSKALEGEIVEVDFPDSPRELCAYVVRVNGSDDTVFESQVTPLPPASNSPGDHLGALHWRGPFRFFSRWDMHRTISRWYEDSEGLPTAIGARIVPQVHEAHALRRVLWASTRRHLLADEDPQARLYEAGMVCQRMAAADEHLRVLVVAPGRRTHRWQSDLELRFGGRSFVRVDASHLAANPRERWASVSQNQRLVLSMGCLQQYPQACAELILEDVWDVVVIDDAHLLRPEDPAYSCLTAASLEAENLLLLGALPERCDAGALAAMFALLRPGLYDADAPEAVEQRIAAVDQLWGTLADAHAAVEALGDGAEVDASTLTDLADAFGAALADDEYVADKTGALRDGDEDALGELVGYLKEHYRLERRVVRSRREHLERFGVSWSERTGETVAYDADESERALAAHLDTLAAANPTSPLQMALRGLYEQAVASAPDRLFTLMEERLDALDTTAGRDHQDLAVFELLDVDMGPREEAMFRDYVIAGAPALDNEAVWIAEGLSMVGQWHAESSSACARFVAAADWIEARLAREDDDEQDEAPQVKVVVACAEAATAQDMCYFLESRLEPDAVEMIHAGMHFAEQNEVVERFRRDHDCRVLVCDETGAAGRDLSCASAVVHLEQPWSARRVERRISWVDRAQRTLTTPVESVVLVGPVEVEQTLHGLYDEALGLYESSAAPREHSLVALDQQIRRAACGGAGELAEVVEDITARLDQAPTATDQAYRVSFDPSDAHLEEDAEFADLLDFIDGVADSLPVRHWARMLGIQDHSAGPGIFDFKWHWSHVRRALTGFDTSPEDVEFLMPQEQVEMMSGTFSRKRALRNENLEFFAPGHRFIDALIEDALSPNDGRATVFARRLGPTNRGKVFLNVVATARLDPQMWGAMDMPAGLVNRAYRHLWPESVSVPVEIDLKGRREPRVVEAFDLIQKIEESYQGPEADQKIEYEIFIQAIEDVARFRRVLDEAIALALDKLRDERAGLVDGAAAELADDLAAEMAFLDVQAARDNERQAGEAEFELKLLTKLIESVRHEKLELDALALVVAGTPQVLMH